MTVKELIEELSKHPPEMLVYVDDTEYGAEEFNSIREREVTHWDGGTASKIVVVIIG